MTERDVGEAGQLARDLALVTREAAGIADRHSGPQRGDACCYLVRMLQGVFPAQDRCLTKAPHGARFGISEALQCEEPVAIKLWPRPGNLKGPKGDRESLRLSRKRPGGADDAVDTALREGGNGLSRLDRHGT